MNAYCKIKPFKNKRFTINTLYIFFFYNIENKIAIRNRRDNRYNISRRLFQIFSYNIKPLRKVLTKIQKNKNYTYIYM